MALRAAKADESPGRDVPFPNRDREGVSMALRAAKADESWREAGYRQNSVVR